MPSTPPPRVPAAYLFAALLAAGMTGCELGTTSPSGSTPPVTQPELGDPALAWVGTFQGEGAGVVGTASVEWSQIELRIHEDADSLALEDCSPCLTLSLDTLFWAMNVRAPSDVELEAIREADGEVRTLQLLRYSGGGGVANFVDASLRVDRGSETTFEGRFLLSR